MHILLKDKAGLAYMNSLGQLMPVNWNWKWMLDSVSGEWLTVETNFLFSDQFNTAPLPKADVERCLKRLPQYVKNDPKSLAEIRKSLGETGLRIMVCCVASIRDDVREGQARCNWCGQTTAAEPPCTSCGKGEYLFEFERHLIHQRSMYVK